MSEYYLLNYELGGTTHTVWLKEYDIDLDAGVTTCVCVDGSTLELTNTVPRATSEKDQLPPDVRDETGGEILDE